MKVEKIKLPVTPLPLVKEMERLSLLSQVRKDFGVAAFAALLKEVQGMESSVAWGEAEVKLREFERAKEVR